MVLFTIRGSLVNYTEDGTIWGVSDGHPQLAEYIRLAEEQEADLDPSLILK